MTSIRISFCIKFLRKNRKKLKKKPKKTKNFLERLFFHLLRPESYFLKYKRNMRLESSISESIRKFPYARLLNIPFLKYKKVPLCQGSKYTLSEI